MCTRTFRPIGKGRDGCFQIALRLGNFPGVSQVSRPRNIAGVDSITDHDIEPVLGRGGAEAPVKPSAIFINSLLLTHAFYLG